MSTGTERPACVLVVDDERPVRFTLRAILEEEGGLEVLEAGDVATAREVLAARPDLDLVLTDLRMPGADGLALLEHLASLPGAPPAIMIVQERSQSEPHRSTPRGAVLEGIMSITPELIKKYAPLVYLHPHDNNRPMAVEDYLNTVDLYDESGKRLTERPTPAALASHPEDSNYMKWRGKLPDGNDVFLTGTATVNGVCKAPCYVNAFTVDGKTQIVYSFFYALNGFATYRVKIASNMIHAGKWYKRNFPWARMGRHEGDWEHITVCLNAAGDGVEVVRMSQHDTWWGYRPADGILAFAPGTQHPIVYSALNTHASYPQRRTYKRDDIWLASIAPTLSNIEWLELADATTSDSLNVYENPPDMPPGDAPQITWSTWENIVWCGAGAAPAVKDWLSYAGRWGRQDLDNSHPDRPPPLPRDAQDDLFNWWKPLVNAGLAPKNTIYASGPKSPPWQEQWWTKEGTPVDMVGWEPRVYYVGTGGVCELGSVAGSWQARGIGEETHAPPVRPGTGLGCLNLAMGNPPESNSLRVYFIDERGHVMELWYEHGFWHRPNDLVAIAKLKDGSAPRPAAATSDLTVAVVASQVKNELQPQVFYVDDGGSVVQLAYADGVWRARNIGAETDAPPVGGGLTSIVVVRWVPRVYYIGEDGHVHQLAYVNDDTWTHEDLTALTQAPNADLRGFLTSCITDDTLNTTALVYYLAPTKSRPDATAEVIELRWAGGWDAGRWVASRVGEAAKAPPAWVDSRLSSYVADGLPVVYSLGPSKDAEETTVQELWLGGDGIWRSTDLVEQTGAPSAARNGPIEGLVLRHMGYPEHQAYFVTKDGSVQILWYDGKNWLTDDLTARTGGGAPAAGSPFAGVLLRK